MNKNKTIKFSAEIRKSILDSLASVGFGHIGGAMSIADALAVLYGGVMNYDPKNPQMIDRDYLIMSKGHCGPALYATLALSGFFPVEELKTLNQLHTNLPSHCDRLKTPGIDMTTGSLGQGVSSAIGIALANKLDGLNNYTYLIVGDGEMQEGQSWEGVMFAAQQKLSHLIMLVDFNLKQLDGNVADICNMDNLDKRLESFGFYAQRINGHDVTAIQEGIERAKENQHTPNAIILETEKGYGCNISEGVLFNHYMNITKDQAEDAKKDIDIRCKKAVGEMM